MTVRYQKWIPRKDLQENPDTLYAFGDNFHGRGFGGQAKEMRGEPNSLGIPTKIAPSMNDDAFFDDDKDMAYVKEGYDKIRKYCRQHFQNGGDLVIPSDGIGTGLAQLETRSPKIFAELQKLMSDIVEMGTK